MDPVQNQTPEVSTPAPQATPAPAAGGEKNTLMGVLAYLGPLVFIPLLTEKNDPFVRYHVRQGLVLFVIEAILWFVGNMLFISMLWPLISLVNLGCLVLTIIGIVNVVQGVEKELPLVGKFSSHFNKI